MATNDTKLTNMLMLTDCLFFDNGSCSFNKKCRYRHCEKAMKQFTKCSNWPHSCRNVSCRYRHPKILRQSDDKTPIAAQPTVPAAKQEGLVSFFWDIENVPIPKGQQPFDIVQRIRQKLVGERGLQEANFACYCNSATIPVEKQENLHHATVRIIHVPDRKPGAVDRQIMLDLDRFERTHRAPATIVLISGDIDFIGKLSDLRHQAGFYVIIIHNKVAKELLKATVNEYYSWEMFVDPPDENPQSSAKTNVNESNKPTEKQKLMPKNEATANGNVLKPKQNPIKPLMESPNESNSVPNTLEHRPSANHRRRKEPPNLTRHPFDTDQSIKPLMAVHTNPIPTNPIVNDASPVKEKPITTVKPRIHSSNSVTQLNQQTDSPFVSPENIPAAISKNIDDQTKKTQPVLFPCPHCTNEFDTVQALRQHQKDKKHLFDCPECDKDFFNEESLKRHQAAKNHGGSKNTVDLSNNVQANSAVPKPMKPPTPKRNRRRKQPFPKGNNDNTNVCGSDDD